MIEVETPGQALIGAPTWDPDFSSNEVQHFRPLPRRFALSATEITVSQFSQFMKDPAVSEFYAKFGRSGYSTPLTPDENCAQISLRYLDAVRFCQWLSQREGIPEDQWCYPGVLDATQEPWTAPADFLQRTGYRLPLEAEWEYACRAGSRTSRHFGDASEILSAYAWYDRNSRFLSRPVGRLKPNDWGFHDMLGNVSEWTHDINRLWSESEDLSLSLNLSSGARRVARGGAFMNPASSQRSAVRFPTSPEVNSRQVGLRVSRTVRW